MTAAAFNSATVSSLRTFMARVVPWPGDQQPGHVNLEYCFKQVGSNGKKNWSGKPHRTVNDFLSFAAWATQQSEIGDIYFCLSLQGRTGQTNAGKLKTARHAKDALALKAIWLDIDVKDQPNAYATFEQAVNALGKFCKAAKLPTPTATVKSGGGLHVYWISDQRLTSEEWRPYAQGLRNLAQQFGLRCDYGVTTDAARILRVPSTFNHKTNPPRPVELAILAPDDIPFATVLGHLPDAGATPGPITVTVKSAPQYDLSAFPPKAHTGPTDKLSDGIAHDDIQLDAAAIIKGCPLYCEAIVTGGRDHQQPIWNLLILGATFMGGGEKIAHAISKGHPTYTPDETERMYARKLREKEEKGLGWPNCTTFQNEGCKQCATCPHLGNVKSPLNLGMPARPLSRAMGVAETASVANPATELRDLYARDMSLEELLHEFNKRYAVTKYGSEILVASTCHEITTMKEQDFHRCFANLVFYEYTATGKIRKVKASRKWFEWKQRRQYLGQGIVFDPSGPPDIPDDMLNLWRGFAIEPKPGDWSLLRNHLLEVICSGNQTWFDYLLGWMAHAVQRRDEPIGVAVALRGEQGAGKGVVARTFGNKLFGKHFAHITNGDQLTGRFNEPIAKSLVLFLDEALWAGDKKGEGVLKGLITEPRLTLEAKFRDPIMVENRLRIIAASNNEWLVPAGLGDRRWFVLNVPSTRKGEQHKAYWDALYSQIDNGGAAALLHDLLAMDLTKFNVRAIPPTAAKAEQQAHSFRDVEAWLYQVLDEGRLRNPWSSTGMGIEKDIAYDDYVEFNKQQRGYRPAPKSVWGKRLKQLLGPAVVVSKKSIGTSRVRYLQFRTLEECRNAFVKSTGVAELEWGDVPYEQPGQGGAEVSVLANEASIQTLAPNEERMFRLMAQARASTAAAQLLTNLEPGSTALEPP